MSDVSRTVFFRRGPKLFSLNEPMSWFSRSAYEVIPKRYKHYFLKMLGPWLPSFSSSETFPFVFSSLPFPFPPLALQFQSLFAYVAVPNPVVVFLCLLLFHLPSFQLPILFVSWKSVKVELNMAYFERKSFIWKEGTLTLVIIGLPLRQSKFLLGPLLLVQLLVSFEDCFYHASLWAEAPDLDELNRDWLVIPLGYW